MTGALVERKVGGYMSSEQQIRSDRTYTHPLRFSGAMYRPAPQDAWAHYMPCSYRTAKCTRGEKYKGELTPSTVRKPSATRRRIGMKTKLQHEERIPHRFVCGAK